MKYVLVLCIVILPAAVWYGICALLRRSLAVNAKKNEEMLGYLEDAEVFDAAVTATEILRGWNVLTLSPEGRSGFYLKTARRDIKPGLHMRAVYLKEFPGKDELLRSAQVFPDDSGHYITLEDYSRVRAKLQGEHSHAVFTSRWAAAAQRFGVLAAAAAGVLIGGIILLIH